MGAHVSTISEVPLVDFRLGAELRKVVAEFSGGWRVIHDTLIHQPYGLFRIYRRGRYIGAQISFPCKSDCEWHAREMTRENIIAFAQPKQEFQINREPREPLECTA